MWEFDGKRGESFPVPKHCGMSTCLGGTLGSEGRAGEEDMGLLSLAEKGSECHCCPDIFVSLGDGASIFPS